MVEPSDFWDRQDSALVARLDGSRLRRVFLQGQMRSRTMVVAQISPENRSQKEPVSEYTRLGSSPRIERPDEVISKDT